MQHVRISMTLSPHFCSSTSETIQDEDPFIQEKTNILTNIGIDDDTVRRDSMHATINALPDPNYATLRALALVSHCF